MGCTSQLGAVGLEKGYTLADLGLVLRAINALGLIIEVPCPFQSGNRHPRLPLTSSRPLPEETDAMRDELVVLL